MRLPAAPLAERPSGSFWKMAPARPNRKNSVETRNHGLAALALDLIDDLVVRRGMELHEDLADHADARFGALALQGKRVEILHDLATVRFHSAARQARVRAAPLHIAIQ